MVTEIPALSKKALRLIETGASMELDDPSEHRLTFLPWLLCQVSMPYRRPGPDVRVWSRVNGGVRLQIEPSLSQDGTPLWPYGVIPRLVLVWLTDQIVKGTGSVEEHTIHLGPSLRSWLAELDINSGGHNAGLVRSQVANLASARFALIQADSTNPKAKSGRISRENIQVADRVDLMWNERHEDSFETGAIRVSNPFYDMAKTTSVPLETDVIKALRGKGSSGLALDVYVWLKARLTGLQHAKKKLPLAISWFTLNNQFGGNYKVLRQFKAKFVKTVREVEIATSWGAAWFTPRFHCDDTGKNLVILPGISTEETEDILRS